MFRIITLVCGRILPGIWLSERANVKMPILKYFKRSGDLPDPEGPLIEQRAGLVHNSFGEWESESIANERL